MYASSKQQFESSYSQICELAELPGRDDPSRDRVNLANTWLSRPDTPRWLIVADNADDKDFFFNHHPDNNDLPLSTFLPQRDGCSILITTRDEKVGSRLTGGSKHFINIQQMDIGEALDLLHETLPERLRQGMSEALLHSLERIPLAINQAAAFMTENDMDIPEYLSLLKEQSGPLLSQEYEDLRRYADSSNAIFATWSLTFNQILAKTPCAADLLIQMSFYDQQGIQKSLLRREIETNLEFTKNVGCLTGFSLVKADKELHLYSMHRLVREATRHWVRKQATRHEWEIMAISALLHAFPNVTLDSRRECMAYIPHALAILDAQKVRPDLVVSEPRLADHRARLLYLLAGCADHFEIVRQDATLKMGREAWQITKALFGDGDRRTRNSLGLYARLIDQNRSSTENNPEELDYVLQHLLKTQEQELDGVERSKVRIEIMFMLEHMGRLEEAQSLASLLIKELPSEGSSQSETLRMLATTHTLAGEMHFKNADLALAEASFREAEKINAEFHGPDSQDTWNIRSWIPPCLEQLKKFDQAEELSRQQVIAMNRKWGKDDAYTARAVENLQGILIRQGKPPETIDEVLSKLSTSL